MNFEIMTGYEFEEYIAKLFKSKGFEVQRTAYSHAGGIDLVAIYNAPIFSGKYIIQCKKYTDTLVGQPVIRDLYGVIMSENANKGILITTSDFTEEAYAFAKNKNIELINGTLLNRIGDIDISDSSPVIAGFNHDRYEYLMNRITENTGDDRVYRDAIKFLRSYVIEDAPFLEELKIFDKIINLNQQLIKRCYKKKSDNIYRTVSWLNIAEIEMIRGNIGVAVNILLDNNMFYITSWLPRPSLAYRSNPQGDYDIPVKETIISNIAARNLYSILKHLDFHNICNLILSKYSLSNEYLNIKGNNFYNRSDWNWYFPVLESRKQEFTKFSSSGEEASFVFSEPYVKESKTRLITSHIAYPYETQNTCVNVAVIIKRYKKTPDQIKAEIDLALNQHGIVL